MVVCVCVCGERESIYGNELLGGERPRLLLVCDGLSANA